MDIIDIKETISSEYEMNRREIEMLPGQIQINEHLSFFVTTYEDDEVLPQTVSVARLRNLASKGSIRAKERLIYICRNWKMIEEHVCDFEAFNSTDWTPVPGDPASAKRRKELFKGKDFTRTLEMREHLNIPEVWAMLVKRAEGNKTA